MSKFEELLAAKLENLSRQKRRESLKADVEEFYNTCHTGGGEGGGRFCEGTDGPAKIEVKQGRGGQMRDSGGNVLHPSASSTARNKTTLANGHYQHAHDLMEATQAKLEEAVKNAPDANAKRFAKDQLEGIKGERIRWAAEADRLGERVERMEANLEAAKKANSGDPATDRRRLREAKDFANGARNDLAGHITNKIGQYEGFADDSKRGIQSHAEYDTQQAKIQAGAPARKAALAHDEAVRKAGVKANKSGVESLTPAEKKLLGIA